MIGEMAGMDKILELSVELAKAHISLNPMSADQVSPLIRNIFQTLNDLSQHGVTPDMSRKTDDSSQGLEPIVTPAIDKAPPVINLDTSDEAFEGLDPWLAARISRRLALQLNREPVGHPTIFQDYLVCLEDGAKVKLLRAYIRKRFGLTFAQYLDKWNLPDDYPVAPPNFLEAKRSAAKTFGLGTTTRARGRPRTKQAD